MEITINQATLEDRQTIQNLGLFYIYEMSRYCGFLKGWETPSNGLYECHDFSRYWNETDRYPFLIKVDQELAGFVLVNKIGITSEVDWNMGEFFIVSKYQGKGVGRYVAEQIFRHFPGVWEVMQIPENKGAIIFWEKIIDYYAKGQFVKTQKIISAPQPYPMIVVRFDSRISQHMFQLRCAERSEMAWVNQCYDEVEFVHSNFDKEIIVIAECNQQKAGIGRLVTVDADNLELGGMYVFEDFRSQGIAIKIVEFLLQQVLPHQTVYCIPFSHLTPFYKQWGFVPCSHLEGIPKEVLNKFLWCREKYPQPTALLVLEKPNTPFLQ